MAASDPTWGVPTPTGTLQGAAVFAWDGAAWQPSGRPGPSVATPTGVLRGVAPFSWDGSLWQPSGYSGPSVPTPTGTLDGVALYTWNGSAWTPAGGGSHSCATPSGTLLGVAGFYWDGTAWQPSGQAGAEVATPMGVLAGMAMFSWSGSAWVPATSASVPTLDISFLSTSTLDSRITLSRPSIGTYFDVTGTMRTAGNNVARFDFDPVTHAALGLLVEESRVNLALQSGNPSAWTLTAAVVVSGATTSPDGTTAGALLREDSTTAVHQAVPSDTIATSTQYTVTCFAKLAAGARLLGINGGGLAAANLYPSFNLTTGSDVSVGTNANFFHGISPCGNGWYRCWITWTTTNTTAFNVELHNAPGNRNYTGDNTSGAYVWGAQVEQGGFPTSYIPTTGATVTRQGDFYDITPLGSWFVQGNGTMACDFMSYNYATAGGGCLLLDDTVGNNTEKLTLSSAAPYQAGGAQSSAGSTTFNSNPLTISLGVVNKVAMAWQPGTSLFAANSVLAPNAAGGALPIGINRLRIGNIGGGVARVVNGYIRRVRYWPRALSSAELQQVTT